MGAGGSEAKKIQPQTMSVVHFWQVNGYWPIPFEPIVLFNKDMVLLYP